MEELIRTHDHAVRELVFVHDLLGHGVQRPGAAHGRTGALLANSWTCSCGRGLKASVCPYFSSSSGNRSAILMSCCSSASVSPSLGMRKLNWVDCLSRNGSLRLFSMSNGVGVENILLSGEQFRRVLVE